MRVSLRKSDPAYDPNANYDVFLDGMLVKHVITADEKRGEILQSVIDDNGRFISDGDKFVEVVRRGRVEIKPRVSPYASGETPSRAA